MRISIRNSAEVKIRFHTGDSNRRNLSLGTNQSRSRAKAVKSTTSATAIQVLEAIEQAPIATFMTI